MYSSWFRKRFIYCGVSKCEYGGGAYAGHQWKRKKMIVDKSKNTRRPRAPQQQSPACQLLYLCVTKPLPEYPSDEIPIIFS